MGLQITPSALPVAEFGQPYNAVLTASGGVAPYTFALLDGYLPLELNFISVNANTAKIAGIPTNQLNLLTDDGKLLISDAENVLTGNVSGDFADSFRIRVSDSIGAQIDGTFSLSVKDTIAPTITNFAAVAVSHKEVKLKIDASDYVGIKSVSVRFSTDNQDWTNVLVDEPYRPNYEYLQSDLRFNTVYYYQAIVKDFSGNISLISFTQVKTPFDPVEFITNALPKAVEGKFYKFNIEIRGNATPHRFRIISGAFPTGFSFDLSTGEISGTAVGQSGYYPILLHVSDSTGSFDERWFYLNLFDETKPVIKSFAATVLRENKIGLTIKASDNIAPVSVTIEVSNDNVNFRPLINKAPYVANSGFNHENLTPDTNYFYRATVRDAAGNVSNVAFASARTHAKLEITTPAVLPSVVEGNHYAQILNFTGGVAPYNFQFVSGSLPAALGLFDNRLDGDIFGTIGTFGFEFRITDAFGQSVSRVFSIEVIDPQPSPDLRLLVSKLNHRFDSKTKPIFAARNLATGNGRILIDDSFYFALGNNQPFVWDAPNQTRLPANAVLRQVKPLTFDPDWTKTANVSIRALQLGLVNMGGGYNASGAYTAAQTGDCGIEGQIVNTAQRAGIALQTAIVAYDPYQPGAIEHCLLFNPGGNGEIWEFGELQEVFDCAPGNIGLIDRRGSVVRYYLIDSVTRKSTLLRATRSKLSLPEVYPSVILPDANSQLDGLYLWQGVTRAKQIFTLGVLRGFQDFENTSVLDSNSEVLIMRDKSKKFSRPSTKKTLRTFNCNLEIREETDWQRFTDFFEHHGKETEFLFVDDAREFEKFARFITGLTDSPKIACLYGLSATIEETLENNKLKRFEIRKSQNSV